jgi:flagellin
MDVERKKNMEECKMASINTNMASINAQSNLNNTQKMVQSSLAKLSSGYRINSAADDAAGLAISEKMRGQISGLNQASSNAQGAISLIQTGEGGLNETTSILQRMRELAVQSASDTNTASDRTKIQGETDQLAKEITRISNTTEFNTQNLLAGGFNGTFQIGANQGQNVNLSVNAMDSNSLGVAGKINTQGATTAVGGVSTVTAIGNGLTAQTYKLATTVTAATTAANATTAAGSTGAANTTGTIGGAYTGSADAQLQIRVDTALAGAPTAISASFDGGKTFGSSVAYSAAMNIGNGLTFTKDIGVYAAGNIESTSFTADAYTAQLQTAGGANVGAAVSINRAQTTATVGDATVGATMNIGFTAAGISAAGSANFQVVSSSASTGATTSNGIVTTAANTVAGLDVSSQGTANLAITAIDNAINTVSTERSKLGAMQNRLEHTITNLGTSSNNMTAAESNIRDVDMAAEMSKFTKNQVLAQAGVSMLAQANQAPQTLLKLLG